jgi:dsRNA-specific ribonuclease
MSREQLLAEHASLVKKYEEIKASGLKLDISRGKPCTEQLDLSDGRSFVACGSSLKKAEQEAAKLALAALDVLDEQE